MKTLPIIFSPEMAKAIREGRKTQTRRVIQMPSYHPSLPHKQYDQWRVEGFELYDGHGDHDGTLVCRNYGQPGDILYVRENFYAYGYWFLIKGKWKFEDMTLQHHDGYQFTDNPPSKTQKHRNDGLGWYLRPSIYMPREISRTWLENQDTEVQRLRDISEDDAKAEGIFKYGPFGEYAGSKHPNGGKMRYRAYQSPVRAFECIWESINGPKSWRQNPWVWAITFKVLSTTGRPESLTPITDL